MVREQAGTFYTDDELRAKAEWVRRLATRVSDAEMVMRLGRYADELPDFRLNGKPEALLVRDLPESPRSEI
jgi:hypothetical protein